MSGLTKAELAKRLVERTTEVDDLRQQIQIHVGVRTEAVQRATALQAQLTAAGDTLARTVQTSHDREAALVDALSAVARKKR